MTDQSAENVEKTSNQFGTFGGVFTPSILTILGVILFMRSGFVTGQAGIATSMLILLLATSITFLTGLSISAIATNTGANRSPRRRTASWSKKPATPPSGCTKSCAARRRPA